jgi:GT2 family glycosyltransferase
VLDHGGGDLTVRCLEHLLALEAPTGGVEIVTIVNGPGDGSAARLRRLFPTVEVIELARNEGFGANNRALEDLDRVRYVGLVNNDAFVEPGWLGPLVSALDEDPGLGAVCPRMVFEPRFAPITILAPSARIARGDDREVGVRVGRVLVDGVDVTASVRSGGSGWGREATGDRIFEWLRPEATLFVPVGDGSASATVEVDAPSEVVVRFDGGAGDVEHRAGSRRSEVLVPLAGERVDLVQNIGGVIFTDGYGADRGWQELDDGHLDAPADVAAWCGGGVLLRPEYLIDVGLLEPRFFLYYEDTDLSWRGLSRGWRYRAVPAARMRHVHSASTGAASELSMVLTERNRLLMLVRNARAALVAAQFVRYVAATVSYARRDVAAPLFGGRRPDLCIVVRRLRSLFGALRALPWALSTRRTARSRRTVTDPEVERWFTAR